MFRRIIKEYELGVEWRDGQIIGLLKPGAYSFTRRLGKTATIFDSRQTVLRVPGQEVILGDRTSLKMNVTGTYRIVNPVQLVRQIPHDDIQNHIIQIIQMATRDIVGKKSLDELLESRDAVNEEFKVSVITALKGLGLEIIEAKIKDVILPADLRAAYTESVSTRLRAKAQLEQARGQSAALRSLANTADLVEKHPQLVQLLSLQKKDSVLSLHFDQDTQGKKR